MQNKFKKVLCFLLASAMAFGMTACGGGNGGNNSSDKPSDESTYSSQENESTESETSSDRPSSDRPSSETSEEDSSDKTSSNAPTSSVEEFLANGMPNYDDLPAEEMIFAAWYAPETNRDLYQGMKDCGFNWAFLNGNYIGQIGGPNYETALTYCDELGIKVFLDITKSEPSMLSLANLYSQHESFIGFNMDEPFMDTRGGNHLGLNQLNQYAMSFASTYPNLNFLVNLNPIWFIEAQNQTTYTYGQYVNALMDKIYQPYQTENASAYKWLSADDYPFWALNGSHLRNGLAYDWLTGLAYLAETKRTTTDMDNVVSNFFIQAMPFGPNNRDRVMTYKEMKLQTYTLMAFGYDAVSFFSYATPKAEGEFTAQQSGLVDRSNKKTNAWYDAQSLISEVKKFQHTYMQFNDNWQGVYLVDAGATRQDFTMLKNLNDDGIESPVITSMRKIKGVQRITATEDVVVGSMLDKHNNPGYMVVNYNDTAQNKTATTEITFKTGYSKAWVYIDGVQYEEDLINNKLTLNLDVGEGVFVIPIKDKN